MLPAQSGAAALVPPTLIQPLAGQPASVTVQYTAYPVAASASAEISGTSRQSLPPVSLQGAPLLEVGLITPVPVCHEGCTKVVLIPPPPPAPLGLRCVS